MLTIHEQEIDYNATRHNVIKALDIYRDYLSQEYVRSEPKITASYSFEPPSTLNNINKIEHAAFKNLEKEQQIRERHNYIEAIHEAVKLLPVIERTIICYYYMQQNRVYERELLSILSNQGNAMGRTKFYQYKNDALNRLAALLNLRVYSAGGD